MSKLTFDTTFPLAESFTKLLRQSDYVKTREQLIDRIEKICVMDNLSMEEKEQLIIQCLKDMSSAQYSTEREGEEIFKEYHQLTEDKE